MSKIIYKFKGSKVQIKRSSWLGRFTEDLFDKREPKEITLKAFEKALTKKLNKEKNK